MKIEASSFTLTRIVTFVPFYTLVNKTKESVFICEDGLDNWTEAQPEEVREQKQLMFVFAMPQTSSCFYRDMLKRETCHATDH